MGTTCAACRATCLHRFLVPAVSSYVHDVAGVGGGSVGCDCGWERGFVGCVGEPGDALSTTCAACRATCLHRFLVPAVSCYVLDVVNCEALPEHCQPSRTHARTHACMHAGTHAALS